MWQMRAMPGAQNAPPCRLLVEASSGRIARDRRDRITIFMRRAVFRALLLFIGTASHLIFCPGRAVSPVSGTSMLILVVEDEALVALAIEWSLESAGHHVLGPTDNVEDAIALCEQRRPDLALIDLNLRDGGDGTIIARHLKERYDTPVFLLTAQLAQARTQKDAVWGVVRKPFDTGSLPRLVQFVADVLEGRKPGSPPDVEIFRIPDR
jgi:CheY-like chemotaxis protein